MRVHIRVRTAGGGWMIPSAAYCQRLIDDIREGRKIIQFESTVLALMLAGF